MKGRVLFIVLVGMLLACSKGYDSGDPSNAFVDLSTPYCNDPQAVNYNWNFPGTADSTVCFYPKDVFEGEYILTDTIFSGDYDINDVKTMTVYLVARDIKHLGFVGFCGTNKDTLEFTADRFFKATADTTITQDSIVLAGQLSCRSIDTLNGYITNIDKKMGKGVTIRINLSVASDTGLNYHIGTAIKQ